MQKLIYSHWDVLLADPVKPLAKDRCDFQLALMKRGLDAIASGDNPTSEDWRVCCDTVNLFETLLGMGTVVDPQGLLDDATQALAAAAKRNIAGGALRLEGSDLEAVRAVIEDYAELLPQLPARTIIQCHRTTERRLLEITRGKRQKHDITVTSI